MLLKQYQTVDEWGGKEPALKLGTLRVFSRTCGLAGYLLFFPHLNMEWRLIFIYLSSTNSNNNGRRDLDRTPPHPSLGVQDPPPILDVS